MRLQGRKVLLGVSSSVAIYKACELISLLKREGAQVRVVMTEEARRFIQPALFEALTQSPCPEDAWDHGPSCEIEHVTWAQWADLIILAPATAHLVARASLGLADDRLTSTLLVSRVPTVIAPAMNHFMYTHEATQAHLERLRQRGWRVVEPHEGRLACGDQGLGRLAPVETILEAGIQALHEGAAQTSPHFARQTGRQDLVGKHILISAGPTREPLDPVRFLSNPSTGKMGFACAEAAAQRGAAVTLVAGPVERPTPAGVKRIDVVTALEMAEVLKQEVLTQDWLIMTAAVADYRPLHYVEQKVKKGADEQHLQLVANPDILLSLTAVKQPHQLFCGFCMETEALLERARAKRVHKQLDLICANSLVEPQAGFASDYNHLYLIDAWQEHALEPATKRALADEILDRLMELEAFTIRGGRDHEHDASGL